LCADVDGAVVVFAGEERALRDALAGFGAKGVGGFVARTAVALGEAGGNLVRENGGGQRRQSRARYGAVGVGETGANGGAFG